MTALLAQSEVDAAALIAKLVKECRDGVSDREAEAVSLAGLWTLDVDSVREGFARARNLRAEAISERGSEIVAELEAAIVANKARAEAAGPVVPKAMALFKRRRLSPDGAKPAPKIEEKDAAAEPKAEPAIKREAPSEAKAEPFFYPKKQPKVDKRDATSAVVVEPVVLSKSAPLDVAKVFAERHFYQQNFLATYFYRDQFWTWNGRCYEVLPLSSVTDQAWKFLDGAKVKGQGGENNRFLPRARDVEEVIKALKTKVSLDPKELPPCWITHDGPEPDIAAMAVSAAELLVFNNWLVDPTTGAVSPLTPRLWTHSAVDFGYDPDANCPRWELFLKEIMPDDQEAQDAIEEWLGYCMTNEIKFEKGMLWIGERRSGKTTLTWLLEQLVGPKSYTSMSFQTWVRGENSRAPLIGKKVAVFPDTRLKPGKAYGHTGYDVGGLDHHSAELLLNIIGRDRVSIGQKYRDSWEGYLTTKIMITSNEPPNLQDAGGVLTSRFIKLEFKQSFFGREDVDLRYTLGEELPGIANRCLAAYRRLCERGRFVQPKSGLELEQKIEAVTNPYAAFMHDCWVRDDASNGPTVLAFNEAFRRWAAVTGRPDLMHVHANRLIQEVKRITEWSFITKYRPTNIGPRHYRGLKCRPQGDE